jgi:pimeloyl-ACP methyl ester carboxylesterase
MSSEVVAATPSAPVERPPDEVRALSRLALRELGGFVASIGEMHHAIAHRAFTHAGAGAQAAHAIHDTVSHAVYGGLRGGARAAARVADDALAARPVADGRAVSTRPGGALALGVLNGLTGDRLAEEEPDLEQRMSIRVDGRMLTPSGPALTEAFPEPTPRMVVFVHGLMGTELTWRFFEGQRGSTYAKLLARDLGTTAVDIRYNSGRHISENGRSLSELLEELVANWPVPVEQVALVGHSMGGLVARSSCHAGAEAGAAWVRRVRHTVTLGTPHMGAPIAQGLFYATAALSALPETRIFGAFLGRRSAGIRDLRHGSLVDADWRDRDPDALRVEACQEVPLVPNATHCFVSATITRSPQHPLGRLIGDTLVLEPSASGRSRTRRIPFRAEHGMHLGGADHLALLNHPGIYPKLRDWLATPPEDLAEES